MTEQALELRVREPVVNAHGVGQSVLSDPRVERHVIGTVALAHEHVNGQWSPRGGAFARDFGRRTGGYVWGSRPP